MAKPIPVLLAVFVAIALVAGCAPAAAPAETSQPTTPTAPTVPTTIQAPASETFKLEAQSLWGVGTGPYIRIDRIIKSLYAATDGRLDITLHPVGAVVASGELLDAVDAGLLDLSFCWGGNWLGKNTALALFACGPSGVVGLTPWLHASWLLEADGLDQYQRVYDDLGENVRVNFWGLGSGQEGLGWFKQPISSLKDFQKLKYRTLGVGALMYKEMGISVVSVAGGEIIPSLEKGIIDAAEYSDPISDLTLGLPDVAKYVYYPGMHQCVGVEELLVNRDAWNELPEDIQETIDYVLAGSLLPGWSLVMQQSAEALIEMETNHGVHIMTTPADIVQASTEAWDRVVAQERAANPSFDRVYESLLAYSKNVVHAQRTVYSADQDALFEHYFPAG
ncbi:MAG: hypothetical protein M0R22_02240 [Dehalococcoidia bacterium]|jgi:TRAP-type mannitol/chloroaromatic compound transport system substrate-binding protein|nr:hypothetical protein [Dehalococcoidia bacterium]